jgi:hypothetical protein
LVSEEQGAPFALEEGRQAFTNSENQVCVRSLC